MRTWKSVFAASLLIALSALAQQTITVTPAAEQTAPAAPQSPAVQPAIPASTAPAPSTPAPAADAPTTMDVVVDRAIAREHALMEMLKTRTPLVETYLQNLKLDNQMGPSPVQDHYFFGRMDLAETVDRRDYLSKDTSFEGRMLGGFTKLFKFEYKPMGFSWMIFADREDFDRSHYDFKYVHREFQGDVRCIVFDVTPKKGSGNGRFLGRIWVEDQDYNIVRLNGTYAPRPRNAYFFHMDSWRLNLVPGYWVPTYIYSEEGDFSYGSKDKMAFKAQTRLWGYNLQKGGKDSELTQVLVDSHEFAHIVLGHNLGSKYAFNDRMLFTDESTYQNLGFKHIPEEEVAADKKAMDLLKNSPYSQKLQNAGLFLKQLADRGPALSALLTAHLGNKLTDSKGGIERMAALMGSAPALDPNKLDQIAALPLGGRVRLNAWDDHVELIKTAPVAITSARDKMPFEVTPFFPRLTRYGAAASPVPPTAASTAQNN